MIKCSNIAMIRNIETKIAVAAKPKEMAFMDVPMSFQDASRLVGSDGVGSPLHDFVLSPKPFMVFGFGLYFAANISVQ